GPHQPAHAGRSPRCSRLAAEAAADAPADGAEAALGDARHGRGAPAAHGRRAAAVVADEDEPAAAAAGAAVPADPLAGLLFGALVEVLLRPGVIAGGQQTGAEKDERELTRHSGHGEPLGDNGPWQ